MDEAAYRVCELCTHVVASVFSAADADEALPCPDCGRESMVIATPGALIAAIQRLQGRIAQTSESLRRLGHDPRLPVRDGDAAGAGRPRREEIARAIESAMGDFIGPPERHEQIKANRRATALKYADAVLSLSPSAAPEAPEGWRLVPMEPTEEMWGELARDLVMWSRFPKPTGAALFRHLEGSGREIPQWLRDEIRDVEHVPPKGTVAACIYKAMLSAAPSPSGQDKGEADAPPADERRT